MSTFVIILIYTTGNPKQKNFIESMKISKLFLNDDVENQVYKCIQDKMKLNNTAVLFNLSQLYHLSSLTKPTLCFVERCFPTIADSQNFLEFDFVAVRKLLSSSGLSIDSELQVFNAAYAWLSLTTERSKYEKMIFSKVRLSLLSESALRNILCENSSFTISDECADMIKTVLQNSRDFHLNNFDTMSRFCNQEKYNIVICGGYECCTENNGFTCYRKSVNDVQSINSTNSVTVLPQMKTAREFCKAICIKNEIYVFGGLDDISKTVMSVEKYSPVSNTWEIIADMHDDRKSFCACSFMNNVYVIGGSIGGSDNKTTSCVEFNSKHQEWRTISSTNAARHLSACAVFGGRIVVSGGSERVDLNTVVGLKTVEAYDHAADSWSRMPDMIEGRFRHKSVAVKNKLFVIGSCFGTTCEVFTASCNKFVLLKQPRPFSREYFCFHSDVVSIGTKFVIVCVLLKSVLVYDVVSEVWSKNTIELKGNTSSFSCTKVPRI